MEKVVYTKAEVAKLLRVSGRTIDRMVERGELQRLPTSMVRFSVEHIKEILSWNSSQTKPLASSTSTGLKERQERRLAAASALQRGRAIARKQKLS
jgi:excisionase family DNA binding protein